MKYISRSAPLILLGSPALALAAPQSIKGIIDIIVGILSSLLPVLMALALLAFFWGLIRFLAKTPGGDELAHSKNVMALAIVALFVMVSLWGLVTLVQRSLFGSAQINVTPSGNVTPWQYQWP